MLHQTRPVVMYEVNQQAFDVRTILILICHDHNLAISQRFQRLWALVFLFVAQAHDLDNVVDLSIVHDLIGKTEQK